MGKKRHLTMDERAAISAGLSENKSATEIGEEIGFAKSTITREVRQHRTEQRTGGYGRSFNDCKHRSRCPKSHECLSCKNQRKNTCAYCSEICCSGKCDSYEREICPRVQAFPYVCNGCQKKSSCTLVKYTYSPTTAHNEYRQLLSSSRNVLHVTQDELENMSATISAGLKKGQSIHHIYTYAEGSLPVGMRTAYNYVNGNILGDNAIRLDLPKAVRCRQRSSKKTDSREKDASYLKGRTYADFKQLMDGGNPPPVVEMDCVEGKKNGNGKVLLTLLFTQCNLQIAFIMEKQNTENVKNVFLDLRAQLGQEMFNMLFKVILTDRGKEFRDPGSIEHDEDGEKTLSVFYCSPSSPQEKPFCERNHVEIRRIFHKGKDIEFDQDDCNRMMDNINSYSREKFNGKSALDMFIAFYGQEAADALGLRRIEPKDIDLTKNCLAKQA